jgi:hypothetical protein
VLSEQAASDQDLLEHACEDDRAVLAKPVPKRTRNDATACLARVTDIDATGGEEAGTGGSGI